MRLRGYLALSSLAVALVHCELVAGLGDFEDATSGVGGGVGGAGGTGGTGGGVGAAGGAAGGSSAPVALASVSLGSTADDLMGDVGTDGTGDIFLAGTHAAEITIHDTHPCLNDGNPFLASFDSSLETRWSRSFATSGGPKVLALETSYTGQTVFGGIVDGPIEFGSVELAPAGIDAFAAKFSDGGGHELSRIWGSPHVQQAYGVDVLNDGILVAGAFNDKIDIGAAQLSATDTDGFVAKLSHAGAEQWTVQLSGPGDQQVRAITAHDNHEYVYVTGIFKADFAVVPPSGAETRIAHGGGTEFDVFVFALNVDDGSVGPHLTWHDDQGAIVSRGINLRAATDTVVVAGSFTGNFDADAGEQHLGQGQNEAFVVQLDIDLNPTWSVHYGAPDGQVAFDAAIDSEGNVAVVGHFGGTTDFGAGPRTADGLDAFLVKLSPTGQRLWGGVFGGPYDDAAMAVTIDGSDNVIVAGQFSDTIDFGNGPLTSSGGKDLFLAKLPPQP